MARTLSPMIKATLQAAVLSSISNLLGQFVQAYRTNKPFHLNYLELLRFVLLTLITAPPNYKWQQFLERTFPAYIVPPQQTSLPLTERDAKRRDSETAEKDFGGVDGNARSNKKLNIKNTLLKWFIDCITVGALINTAAFYIIMGALKGQSTAQIQRTVQTETIPLIITGYKVWPIVSIISFSFVPVERRIVFISSVGLLWGIYMSIIAANV